MQFHFDQSKFRSEIRLREGRTKPIDVLSKQLNPSDDFDIEINEPYMVFKVKSGADCEISVLLLTNARVSTFLYFPFPFCLWFHTSSRKMLMDRTH